MKKQILAITLSVVASAFFLTAPARAVSWTEVGDAGQTPATAQAAGTTSGQSLTPIFGTFSSATDIDLFVINITNPPLFLASTVNALTGGGGLDTELFLFDSVARTEPGQRRGRGSGQIQIGQYPASLVMT